MSDLLSPKPATEQRESDPAWDEASYEKWTSGERSIYAHLGQEDACTDGKVKRKDVSEGCQAMHRSHPGEMGSGSSSDAQNDRGEGLPTGSTVELPGPETLYRDKAWYSSEDTSPIEGPIIPEYLLSRGYLGGFDLATKQRCQFWATDLDSVDGNLVDMHAIDKLYPGLPHIARIAELVRRKIDPELNAPDPRLPLNDARRNLEFYLGRALVFLIAGPSGVGKTATVQASKFFPAPTPAVAKSC